MSVMTEVISESDEVLISLYGGILNWTTDVAEDSSEYFGCPNASDSIGSHHLLYGVLAYVTELMVPKG